MIRAVRIFDLIQDSEILLALEPEELAGIVLEYLIALPPSDTDQLNRQNFSSSHTVKEYALEYHASLTAAFSEAWMWLEREGLIGPRPGTDRDWVFVTRRGRQVADRSGVAAYKKANLLPKQLIHGVIAQKVWATFLRGDYDTAVFQAFKEVELAVRNAGGFPNEDLGTDLMRKAFHQETGPLTDQSMPRAEREALAHLFAGAIGSYKNPHSHRAVVIEAEEAVEMIILASHLLNIVDGRHKATT